MPDKPGHDDVRASENNVTALLAAAVSRGPTPRRLPGGFVYLRDVDPDIIQDIRYAELNNFVGRPLAGYGAGECVVKREVGLRLKAFSRNWRSKSCR